MSKVFREAQIDYYIWAIEHYTFAIGNAAANREHMKVFDLNFKALKIRTRAKRELSRPINEVQEKFDVAFDALEKLEAGFAGMFGNQSISYKDDAIESGSDIVIEALKKIRPLNEG